MKRLVSIRRRVPWEARRDYGREWASVIEALEGTGARAWRFVASGGGDEVIEFLEFDAGSDPRADTRVSAVLDALASEYGALAEEWDEVDRG